MRRTFDWLRRIKSVEREFLIAQFAADRLLAEASSDPTVLPKGVSLRDLRETLERLDGTYIIRLFAEFEAGLRQFWSDTKATDSPTRTRDLLEGIGASCKIPHELRENAHTVREHRNSLIHERDEPSGPLAVSEARHHLCRFFSYLPPDW